MTSLPNPFQFATPQVAEQAAASPLITPGTVDAAAEPFRFVLEEERFLSDIALLGIY